MLITKNTTIEANCNLYLFKEFSDTVPYNTSHALLTIFLTFASLDMHKVVAMIGKNRI